MLGILNVLNKYFWKSWSGPFFTFIFAPVITIISTSLFSVPNVILPGTLEMPVIAVGVTVLPQAVYEFRKSVILKRIGATHAKPATFIFVATFYFAFLMAIAGAFNLSVSMLLLINDFDNIFLTADYGTWIFSQILAVFLSLAIGMFSASIFKSILAIQSFGILLILASILLAGVVVPYSLLVQVPALKIISYFIPFKYTTGLAIESWFGNLDHILNNSTYTFTKFDWYGGVTIPDTSKINTSKIDIGKFVGQFLANKNYLYGSYDSAGKFIVSDVDFSVDLRPEVLEKIKVTYIDTLKGLVYETTMNTILGMPPTIDQQADNAADTNLTVLPTRSLFNFMNSTIWDVSKNYLSIESSLGIENTSAPNFAVLWNTPAKIANFGAPFLFMLTGFSISIANFKWSGRGH